MEKHLNCGHDKQLGHVRKTAGQKERNAAQMYEKDSITGRLNQLYQESKLTREEFAKRCEISTSALTNYLKGSRTPDAIKLPHICEEFNVSADWLLGLSDVRKPSAELKGVVEFTGLSESAINKIVMMAKADEQIKKVLSRAIESSRFDEFIYRLYIYMMHVDNLKESDFDDENKNVDWEFGKVSLYATEATGYFKQGVKDAVGKLCNDLYIQAFQQIKFTKAPAKIRLVSADELVYMPTKDSE